MHEPRISLFDHLLEFTRNYFGLRAHEANRARKQQAAHTISEAAEKHILGEPQPICRLLDSSADIAEEYSKPDGCLTEAISLEYQKVFTQASEREILRKETSTTAVTGRPAPAPNHPFTLANLLGLECQQVIGGLYGSARCSEYAVGMCTLCELVICSECESYAICAKARNSVHQVVRQ